MSWYNSSWKYRVKITVDKDKVGSTLTDFPVYVDLSTLPSGFHSNVKNDGGDIRVTRSDGTTECPREVVFYDATNDKGELHFKANSLSSTSDTDFYIYYGNANASDYSTDATYGTENVWTEYKAVWHSGDASTTTSLDSTSNGNDLDKKGSEEPEEVMGKMGKAQHYDGYDDYLNCDSLSGVSDTHTVSAWIRADSLTAQYSDHTTYGFTIFADDPGYPNGYPVWLTVMTNGKLNLRSYQLSTTGTQTTTSQISIETWYLVTVTATKNGTSRLYVNGSQVLSFSNNNEATWASNFRIGELRPNRKIVFDGIIDEVRVASNIKSADWISAEYTNQNSPTTFYTAGSQECWYNSNWKYRVKITVDHSKIGSDLTDFPVYVDLSTLPSGFHTNVKSDGGDIRVTRSDGTTECPREVVFYDSTNDKGELHFKANSLSSTTDTNFYIYYGNSSATEPASDATYGSENVWSAYEGVWHGNDTTTTTISDSTSNHYTGTKLSSENPLEVTGKIGKAQSYSSDRIDLGDVLDLGTNDASITQWIKVTDTSSAAAHSFAKSRADSSVYRYSVRIATSGVAGFIFIGASGQIIYEGNVVVDDNSWHKVTVNFDRDGNGSVRVDGADAGSTSISTYSGQNFQSTMHTWIGAYPASNDTDIFSAFPGLIDETRIKFSLTSSDWDSAEYTNQATPTTFYTVGTQEAGSTDPIVGKKYPLPPFRRS